MSGSIEIVEDRTLSASGQGVAADTSETNLISRVFNALTIGPKTISLSYNLIVLVAEDFGVHPIFVHVLNLFIIVSVIFLIWSAIMKWEL